MVDQLNRVLTVIGASLEESTKELYGTGLLVYHVYCDINDIPDVQRAPINPNLLASFLASCAGAHSGSTISNYAAAVKAWHILHGLAWNVKEIEYKALLDGVRKLAPPSSRRPKWAPFTIPILEHFCMAMDLSNPRDAVILACLICAFFSITHLGELTVLAISKYNLLEHISRAGLTFTTNHENLPVIKFSLPRTKTSSDGEEAHCAPLDPSSTVDPKSLIENHFKVNLDVPGAHIFSWMHHSGSTHPLSKKEVMKWIDAIIKEHPNLPDLKGHSLHIGGTLYYLLLGTPFDVVKTMGRWSSDTFSLYLRHHALVLAPFLQHCPDLMDNIH